MVSELTESPLHQIRRSALSRTFVDRLYFRLGLPIRPLLNVGTARVAYSPDFTVPASGKMRRAVTIHDLAWQIHPDLAPPGLKRFLDRVVPAELEAADRVFTVSESSKIDILQRYQVEAERIVVAPNGVEERFLVVDPGNILAVNGVSLPEEYLLMVGSIEPRKNHINILRAIELVPDCPVLLIAGGRGWADDAILRHIVEAETSGKAIALGHVADEALPTLYARATVVISASWYEGFGLPVLEGLAAGSRVVASDVPAHREIAGPHATFSQPADVESLADGIITALDLGKLSGAARSSQQDWAGRFTWDNSADRVYQTLRELL
jgi:glycosyltransferase involved in cell wall biosynthesis